VDCQDLPSRRGPVKTVTLTANYAEAVLQAGGIPWLFPYTENRAYLDQAVATADGLLLSGGDFDIDPHLFGETPHPQLGKVVPERTATERALLKRAEARRIPILGICGGMQLMNVSRGGTLYQDLPSQKPAVIEHQQPQTKDLPGHQITIRTGSQLAQITGQQAMGVNSTHHQAVKTTGRDLIVSATAPDGVVEAIEDPLYSFYLGVQWHPEAMPDPSQKALYQAFIAACLSQI
jgi:putative glutamine amidotransferase